MKYGYMMPATYALRLCGQPNLQGLSEDGEVQDAKGGIILEVSPNSFSLQGNVRVWEGTRDHVQERWWAETLEQSSHLVSHHG